MEHGSIIVFDYYGSPYKENSLKKIQIPINFNVTKDIEYKSDDKKNWIVLHEILW